MTSSPFDDLAAFAALSLLPICRVGQIAERLRNGSSPSVVFDRITGELWPDEPERARATRIRASQALHRASSNGIAPVAWNSPAYPPSLSAITDPPPVLWVRGDVAALTGDPVVAIVGARAASPYGLAVAGQLAGDLASRGIVVVSGLARGADSAAHRGSLAAGGITAAVLGSGVDVVYPPEHASLARDIALRGAIVSELAPGTPPHARFFPQRNRIISGLARAIVVIEAGEKSGSLITARCALEQGRDVLAVPGNVLTGRNRGAHALLRDGAKIVESADDILEELGLPFDFAQGKPPESARGESSARLKPSRCDGPQGDPVLSALTTGEPCDLDAIAERTGLQSARLLPRLFELEVRGLVRRAGGGRFVRIDRPC
jgi:DNA processing protein